MNIETSLEKFSKSGDISDAIEALGVCKNEKLYSLGLALAKKLVTAFPLNPVINCEVGTFHYFLGEMEAGFDIFSSLLKPNVPHKLSNIYTINRSTGISKVLDRYIQPPKSLPKPTPENGLVTFTITTCKRYTLFEKTMNSFLNCCLDLHLISKFLCIDDNSSEEDRVKMKENYPFFEFIFKDKSDKGHPRSMNIIRDKADTQYVFHMEDDWCFFEKRNYITECLEILSSNREYGQCLVNKNYSESASDNILGGDFKMTSGGMRYFVHEFCHTDAEKAEFSKKHGIGSSVFYWPHFSLRPSLLKKCVFDTIGRFNENTEHFEREYAYRYIQFFKSVFLETIYCTHIGRLTSQRDDPTKLNAYILNGEDQFVKEPKEPLREESKGVLIGVPTKISIESKAIPNLETLVINLNRRPDRIKRFSELNTVNGMIPFSRFSAIDGLATTPTEQLQRIFDGNDYNMRSGMVGCALSHIKIYIDFVNSEKAPDSLLCILEDDITVVPDFGKKVNHLLNELKNQEWDLCYLGHHLWPEYQTPEVYSETDLPTVEKWNTETSLKKSIGGTGGYLITKKGAVRLLEFINRYGMRNGIDTIQQKAADYLSIYYCTPHLIRSDCWTNNKSADTDIQLDLSSLTIPVQDRLFRELEHLGDKALQLFDFSKACEQSTTPGLEKVLFFVGQNEAEVLSILSKSAYPCYSLSYKVAVVCPKHLCSYSLGWFERLKKDGIWTLECVPETLKISPTEATKRPVIVLGDNSHISEAVEKCHLDNDNIDFPFNKMDGINLVKAVSLTRIILEMNNTQIQLFSEKFCSPKFNETYVQSFNNKTVVRNTTFDISFPHDNVASIAYDYSNRFVNLRDTLKTQKDIFILYGTRFSEDVTLGFDMLVKLIKSYNPDCNLHILSLNGITSLSGVQTTKVMFPEVFRNLEWTHEKINYDQRFFRLEVEKPIKKFLSS